jgi:hypothetical protein
MQSKQNIILKPPIWKPKPRVPYPLVGPPVPHKLEHARLINKGLNGDPHTANCKKLVNSMILKKPDFYSCGHHKSSL